MIPKIIHQIWFQDTVSSFINWEKLNVQTINERKDIINESLAPKELKIYQRNWILKNPAFKYVLWNENSIRILFKIDSDIKLYEDMYNKLDFIQKIDFSKYIIIKNYGGFYIDMDIDCLKSITKIYNQIKNKGAVFSAVPDLYYLEKLFSEKMFGLENVKFFINNGIFGGINNHKIWTDILKEIKERINKKNGIIPEFLPSQLQAIKVFKTTGPAMFTTVINRNNYSDMIILNQKYLDPCYGFDYTCSPTKDSYAQHYHKSYWIIPEFCRNGNNCNNLIRFVGKTYFFVRNFFVVIFLVILCLIAINIYPVYGKWIKIISNPELQ